MNEPSQWLWQIMNQFCQTRIRVHVVLCGAKPTNEGLARSSLNRSNHTAMLSILSSLATSTLRVVSCGHSMADFVWDSRTGFLTKIVPSPQTTAWHRVKDRFGWILLGSWSTKGKTSLLTVNRVIDRLEWRHQIMIDCFVC
jgi:hypothetical protein